MFEVPCNVYLNPDPVALCPFFCLSNAMERFDPLDHMCVSHRLEVVALERHPFLLNMMLLLYLLIHQRLA